ncbi:hypothetical protein [Sphingomonas sp. UYEF23]|uniref:hypothetical protein n=1 Tax=Sphingomonas sp. UYEF23 TaxID=1756408 RepID=UPI00339680E8
MSDGLGDRLRNTVREAWPDGVDPDGEALLAKLNPDEQNVAEHRLAALLEVEAGQRPASRAPLNDPRGITNAGFQSLVRRWRQERHPRTLLPYASRAKRQRGESDAHQALERALDGLLAEPRPWTLVTLTREALARTGVTLALNTARIVARERRARLRADPVWLAEHYGRQLLSDVCALGIECEAGGGEHPAVIAATVEVSSGLVLGYAVGPTIRALALQRSALAQGLATLVSRRLDVQRPLPADVTIVVGTSDMQQLHTMDMALREGAPTATVVAGERRRSGDRLADVLDGAIDTLPLHPRGGAPRRVGARGTPWSEAHLASFAANAVAAHNAIRFARLDAAEIDSWSGIGVMVSALRPVVAAVASIMPNTVDNR